MDKKESRFEKIKKFFSPDINVYNYRGTNLMNIDPYDSKTMSNLPNNYLQQRYNRYLMNYVSDNNFLFNRNKFQANRTALFYDYELMDCDPIISSVLDLYAEETVVRNELGKIVTIEHSNDKIKKILDNLFYDILNIEYNLLGWVRNLVKYGDHFLKLNVVERIGVIDVIPISVYDINREENFNPKTSKLDVTFKLTSNIIGTGDFNFFEVAHFRLFSDNNYIPYGKSLIEGGRRTWKQLNLMEDAMLIYRIMRAPQKRVFKIDVGNLPNNEVQQYINNITSQIKQVPYIDQNTGDYNLYYNTQNIVEDFVIPVRGDSATSIDTLQSGEYSAIEDIEYLKNKMLAAFRVPKGFLTFDEAIGAKATLAQEDLRFQRTVERIQKIVESELIRIAKIHLYLQGFDSFNDLNFTLKLNNPSIIYEQEKLELWKSKVDLANSFKEQKMVDSDWVYKNVYKFNDDEIKKYKETLINDCKFEHRLQQILNEGNDPNETEMNVDSEGTVRDADDPSNIYVKGKDSRWDDNEVKNDTKIDIKNNKDKDLHDTNLDKSDIKSSYNNGGPLGV